MNVTIYEVAKAAGVSPSTVSNVLNGRVERMQPATRARVDAAIRKLKYSPNRSARRLRSGGIHTIGLVVPTVSNPFWGTFASLLEGAALEQGYGMLLCNSGRNVDRERTYLEELLNDGVAGVVLGSSLRSVSHVAPLIKRGLRVVTLDRSSQSTDPKGLIDISVDNRAGAALVAEHLYDAGHRTFAFVSGEVPSVNRQERLAGFLDALAARGVQPSEVKVWKGHDRADADERDLTEVGRDAARAVLSGPGPAVTAIATVNDLCAIGVFRGIRDAGLDVGRDVAVAGFDDIPFARLIHPTLTTVRQPLDEMSAIAIDRLVAMINEPNGDRGTSVELVPELIVRESTAGSPRGPRAERHRP